MTRRRQSLLLSLLLFAAVLLCFGRSVNFDFVNFDDPGYVTENPIVRRGITWEGIKYACTRPVVAMWSPVTVFSYMLDVQLFGARPGPMHAHNVLLHAVNSVLVLLLLHRLTGSAWRSFLAAALFALHPLRVESVVWISERKDVLSGLFGILTLLAYVRYARAASGSTSGGARRRWYGLTFLLLLLGLLAKPMLVTWPLVMLLLDYWPLRRLRWSAPGSAPRSDGPPRESMVAVVLEKLPLLALVAVCSVATFMAQESEQAVRSLERLPLGVRLGHAVVAYGQYLSKTLWPVDLIVLYPHPGKVSMLELSVAAVVLLTMTTGAIVLAWPRVSRASGGEASGGGDEADGRPSIGHSTSAGVLVGWLWFLGTLVPVIGLVQVGSQSIADRYTYVPHIGLFLALACLLPELRGVRRGAQVVLAALVLLALAIPCYHETRHWRNSSTLFRHALRVNPDNYTARVMLGVTLRQRGQLDEAIEQFQAAIRLSPRHPKGYTNLASAYREQGDLPAALAAAQRAVEMDAHHAPGWYVQGMLLAQLDRHQEALPAYERAISLQPDNAGIHTALGATLGALGEHERGMRHVRRAVALDPLSGEAHNNLAQALLQASQVEDAVAHLELAVRYEPRHAVAQQNLAIVYRRLGRTADAIRHYRLALELNPDNAALHNDLGVALGQQGQVQAAAEHFAAALRLRPEYPEAQRNLEKARKILEQMP